MTSLEILLSVCVGIASIVSMLGTAVATYIGLKLRTTIAEFRVLIVDIIRNELKSYVPESNFLQYSRGHSDEHVRIQQDMAAMRAINDQDHARMNEEINKLRESRHDIAQKVTTNTLEIGALQSMAKSTMTHLNDLDECYTRHDEIIKGLEKA